MSQYSNLEDKHHQEHCLICEDYTNNEIATKWKGSTIGKESTLHQIAPYIGKMKSSMASALITHFTRKSDFLYDPFCGSGTVAFEAWAAGRHVIANDYSPYAYAITKAKLFPYFSLDEAINEIDNVEKEVDTFVGTIDLRRIPPWIRSFFHPETLREIIAWVQVLSSSNSYFLLSCLLGILHHQRPGFLSYPSSHTVPYLRQKKFPSSVYPALYKYRAVRERLEKKVIRALKRVPELDSQFIRECHLSKATDCIPRNRINTIITSPPYMRRLDYARDNRLRLWFLGVHDWKLLDHTISPSESSFVDIFRSCLRLWQNILTPGGLCVFVLGDTPSKSYKMTIPELMVHVATEEIGGYSLLWNYSEPIPEIRRVRRNYCGNMQETILVLRNEKGM